MLQGAPPRGPRGTTSSSRGRGRNGIQKRRADGPMKVDRDGDLNMEATTAGDKRRTLKSRMEVASTSRGRGRGGGRGGLARGSFVSQKAQAAILRGIGAKQTRVVDSRKATTANTLAVEGLDDSKAATNLDGGVDALATFLERKASAMDAKSNRTVKIEKKVKKDSTVFITASTEDIIELLKVDGFTFAGAVLSITPAKQPIDGKSASSSGAESSKTQEVKAQFQAVLASRYDAGLKLLNLAALSQDSGLQAMGLFDGTTNTSKVFPALMAVCDGLFKSRAAKKEAIASVILADNHLDSVADVNALAHTFPDLKNIDLSRNNLADMKALDPWRYKFKQLENLVLNDNPIVAQLETLKDEFLRRYQKMSMLSGVQVRTPEQLAALEAAAEAAKSPLPIAGPDFRDVSQVGENFIIQFLSMYDKDRSALVKQFYDTRSTFSLTIDMKSPRNHQNSKPIPPWADYTKHNRNHMRLDHQSARLNRLMKGVSAIKGLWNSLPVTHHPDLATQSGKYLIECHPLPGLPDPTGQSARGVDGLIITMHGEFEEGNSTEPEKPTRSFSRTFVLGPGMPGIQPIKVISDMLLLRAWAPLAQPTVYSTPPQQHAQMAMPQQAPMMAAQQMSEQQQKEAMASQLMEKTGMVVQYAVFCLEQTGWNLENAYAAFTASRADLPPDAFQPGVVQ